MESVRHEHSRLRCKFSSQNRSRGTVGWDLTSQRTGQETVLQDRLADVRVDGTERVVEQDNVRIVIRCTRE
jgi:hypothetical protein